VIIGGSIGAVRSAMDDGLHIIALRIQALALGIPADVKRLDAHAIADRRAIRYASDCVRSPGHLR
jgi:hypothetical protein